MIHNIHTERFTSAAQRLQDVYTGMIGGSAGAAEWDEVDALWDTLGTVYVEANEAQGLLDMHGVTYELGSLPGFAVKVALSGRDGTRETALSVNGSKPNFAITPVFFTGLLLNDVQEFS